jgi:hypothetical protein
MEQRSAAASDLYRVITPYNAEAFHRALDTAGLTSRYPNLVIDIQQGSPIGNPLPVTETFVPPNMKSALEHPQFIDQHITEEVEAGRMSGPYTRDETHHIFGGHFQTTPLGIIEQEPGSNKLHLIGNLSKKDRHSISVNNMVDSNDFPTHWGSAWIVEQYVSMART